jgi:hypothetical protein
MLWMWIALANAAPVLVDTGAEALRVVGHAQVSPRTTVLLLAEDPEWRKVIVVVDDRELETTRVVEAPGVVWWRAETRQRGDVQVQIDRCSASLCVPGQPITLPFTRSGQVHRFQRGQMAL